MKTRLEEYLKKISTLDLYPVCTFFNGYVNWDHQLKVT